MTTFPCSKANALPWTNITHPQAEAACASIGARLCTEAEWEQTCAAARGPSPAVQGGGPNFLVDMEAEDYDALTPQGGHTWVVDTSNAGFSGRSALLASPNSGTNNNTGYATSSPRLDYAVNFNQTGTHYVWILGWGESGSDDSVHAGINGTTPTTADRINSFSDAWTWHNDTMDGGAAATINVPSTGLHTLNIWMREDGFIIDRIILTTSSSFTPSPAPNSSGCTYSYASTCTTYQPDTCNGNDYDYDPGTSGDQDAATYSGQMAMCYADLGSGNRVYDMSGNVREWTAERSAGVNPMRGGSYTAPGPGLTCGFDFMVADDSFFFPNVGFRCCR